MKLTTIRQAQDGSCLFLSYKYTLENNLCCYILKRSRALANVCMYLTRSRYISFSRWYCVFITYRIASWSWDLYICVYVFIVYYMMKLIWNLAQKRWCLVKLIYLNVVKLILFIFHFIHIKFLYYFIYFFTY